MNKRSITLTVKSNSAIKNQPECYKVKLTPAPLILRINDKRVDRDGWLIDCQEFNALKLCLHPKDKTLFSVSEITTGLIIARGKSKSDALRNAFTMICAQGIKKTLGVVDAVIARSGPVSEMKVEVPAGEAV